MRSSAFESTYYPDPPKKGRTPPPPPAPTSKAEQMRSSSMSLSQTYEKPPEAAGKPSGGGGGGIFGDAPPRPPPPPKPAKAPPPKTPTSKAEQNASSAFGTPRQYEKPDAFKPSGDIFGSSSTHVRPPEPEKRKLPNATSKAEQNASSVFGTPRYTKPPEPPPAGPAGVFPGQTMHAKPAAGAIPKEFAPGEWIAPTPRSAKDGAPRSKAAQAQSASLPGTRFERPEPPPPPPKKEPARSKNEQAASSVFGTPRYTEPPPKPPPGAGGGGPFPNAPKHPPPPPKPPKEPPPPIAASKAEQQQSSVFGPPSYTKPPTPRAPAPTYFGSKSVHRAPSPRPKEPPRFVDPATGKARPPQTTQEQQTSLGGVANVLGGCYAAEGISQDRIHRARSFVKVEFDGLPPDQDSHRLHQALSALPYEPGITVNRSKVKVDYGGIDGRATGKASAQFRNVPDGDTMMATLAAARARGLFGRNGSIRLAFDDRKTASGMQRGDTAGFIHRKSHKGKSSDGFVRV